jgi:membrane-associated two-gene conflict system component 1 (EACC1)
MEYGEPKTVEFAVSDPAALGSLTSRIGSLSSLVVRRRGEAARAYELGAADVLTVVGGSAALVAAINLLPDFLGSRRAGVKVRVKVGEREVEMQAANATDTVRVLEKILGE